MNNGKGPDLADYIQAGYPCIFLRTTEAYAVDDLIRAAVREQENSDRFSYGIWKSTTGLLIGGVDTPVEQMRSRDRDLIPALAYIETTSDHVIALYNLRQFMENYQVIQQLQDTIIKIRLTGSHLVLVGPHLDLPPELSNLVTFVDVPLPSKEQIEKQYTDIIERYADDLDLPRKKEERMTLIRAAANSAVGLDLLGSESAIALSMARSRGIDLSLIQAQKEQQIRQSDVLEFIDVKDSMDDVGGFDVFKNWLIRRKRAFSEEAREYGLPYPKGMLVCGIAGTGKSLLCKATAKYLNLPCLRLDIGKIFKSLVGASEAAIREALKVAEAVSPCVLWLEELEKGLAGARGSGELDSGVTARVVSTILTWRQETTAPVVLVATANDVTSLPSMVYRSGRLDAVWASDIPNLTEREEIFKIHLRKRRRDPKKFNCSLLAERSKDFTGAEIESCIEDAMFSAFDEGEEVTTKHILVSIRDTIPQAQRDKEEIMVLREWVETRARKVSSGKQEQVRKASVRRINPKKKTGGTK